MERENQLMDMHGLDLIFRKARSFKGWEPDQVSDEQLKDLYDLMKWGPTAYNSTPVRILFLRSPKEKARLIPALDEGNITKVETASVTTIIGYETRFHEDWQRFFHADYGAKLRQDSALAERVALRNGSIQGGYFIIAARALGLDVGPISGFNNQLVDNAFFSGTTIKSNFLCNLGQGAPASVKERGNRFAFEEVCQIL